MERFNTLAYLGNKVDIRMLAKEKMETERLHRFTLGDLGREHRLVDLLYVFDNLPKIEKPMKKVHYRLSFDLHEIPNE